MHELDVPGAGSSILRSFMRPQTILITGASSGIGRALAFEYARGGAHLALSARRTAELEKVAAEVHSLGGTAVVIPLDVADVDAVGEAVRRAEKELGSLDMVVANAGRGHTRLSSRLAWKDVERIIDVNIRGAMATLVAAIPIFVAQQRGHLVGVSSLAGVRGLPTTAAYSASKATRSGLPRVCCASTSAPPGIRVTGRPLRASSRRPSTKAPHTRRPFSGPSTKPHATSCAVSRAAPAVVAFPWPMVLATSFSRLLPAWVYDRVIRLGSPDERVTTGVRRS